MEIHIPDGEVSCDRSARQTMSGDHIWKQKQIYNFLKLKIPMAKQCLVERLWVLMILWFKVLVTCPSGYCKKQPNKLLLNGKFEELCLCMNLDVNVVENDLHKTKVFTWWQTPHVSERLIRSASARGPIWQKGRNFFFLINVFIHVLIMLY